MDPGYVGPLTNHDVGLNETSHVPQGGRITNIYVLTAKVR